MENITLGKIKQNPYLIRFLENPTYDQYIEIIKWDPMFIKYMKQTEKICLAAVKQNG